MHGVKVQVGRLLSRVRMREMSFKVMVFHNFWLKLIALAMAVVTWLYVNGELTSGIRV